PCQKQPSTKTATLARVKTMSARARRPGSGRASTRYRRPRACAARRTSSSGRVSRLRFARIWARTAALDAHDSATSSVSRIRPAGAVGPAAVRHPRPLASGGMRSVELFAGGGGLALGTHLAGFTTEVVAEWDRWSCDTLRENQA